MRTSWALLAASAALLVACSSPEDAPAEKNPAAAASTQASAPEPAYSQLDEGDLEDLLLTIDDMPAGSSVTDSGPPSDKTFCDYDEPHEENTVVRRDFQAGAGMETTVSAVSIRQFDGPDQAREAFDALAAELQTCRKDTLDGENLTYAQMKAPDLGEDSLGVRIEGGATILQNFVLVGPVLITGGTGGITDASADLANDVVAAQVDAYEKSAR